MDENDEYTHLRDKFDPNVSDEEFIATLENEGGWIIVTCDRGRNNPVARQAWSSTGLTVVILPNVFPKWGLREQASWILQHWTAIRRAAEKSPTNNNLVVNQKGKVERK